jgi:hypothetical protein
MVLKNNILKILFKIKLKLKIEDDPHETISRICIGDFLYGDNTAVEVKYLQENVYFGSTLLEF